MTPGLFNILTKHAAQDPKKVLDSHFSTPETAKWETFRKAVSSKKFVDTLKADPRADDKMKRYAEAMQLHASGKGSESFTVPGQKKNYTVKYHQKQDRFTCSCPDWGYARSHQTDKAAQECKHIKLVKHGLQSSSEKLKTASWEQALRSITPAQAASTLNIFYQKGKMDTQAAKSKAVIRAYKEQMPKQASIRGMAAKSLLEQI